MAHTWFKALHLVGIVVWFSGLFYLVRLFVYHAEAEAKPEPARTILKEQFALMEARLWSMICQPGAALALGMGVAMLVADSTWLSYGWLHVKLGFVALLVLYHGACGNWRKQLAAGTCTLTASRFRMLNEAPTVLLVAIVLLAVFKGAVPIAAAAGVLTALLILLAAGIRIYARFRTRAQKETLRP